MGTTPDKTGTDLLAAKLAEAREEVRTARLAFQCEREARGREVAERDRLIENQKDEIRKYEAKVEAATRERLEAERALRERMNDILRSGGLLLSDEQRLFLLRYFPDTSANTEPRRLLRATRTIVVQATSSLPFRGPPAFCAQADQADRHAAKSFWVSVAGVLHVTTFCRRSLTPPALVLERVSCRECDAAMNEAGIRQGSHAPTSP